MILKINKKKKNDTHDNLDEKNKDGIKNYFRYYSKYNTINNLCTKISSTMNGGEAKQRIYGRIL
jgi:hypothetical protein